MLGLENRMVMDSEWMNVPERVATCSCCGKELRCGNDLFEPDEIYGYEGYTYCNDCFDENVKASFRIS